jgi:TPR repeat protein/chaperonin cofactor prefoldin
MKQTLHWNVSGIPPEARDVARAAANKEGLTVGDWLTRRILAERETPEAEPEAKPDAAPEAKPMGPRLVRLENEPDPVARRVEESLRFLSKRIEVSERAQIEAQRTLSTAAAEIQSASRNQAEVFASFAERIERVERNSDTAPLREALRGLHQGVALLTEQIARTSTDSASQVAVLASSVEAMALKIASARDESVRLEHIIQERLSGLSERVKQLEERVQAMPTAQHVLENRIDAVEIRMREAFSQHVAAVEHDVATIIARLDEAEPVRGQGHIQETIATLNRRFESSERRSKEALAALQSGLSEATVRINRLEAPTAGDPSQQNDSVPTVGSDLRALPLAEAEEAEVDVPRTDASSPGEYLAKTRRAAQAADPTPASAWHVPSATRRTLETSRLARIATQGFFVLLVMCTGFLLMQYLGPQLIPGSIRNGAVGAPASAEIRGLALKANEGVAGAELLLGLKYADGDGVPKNDAEAALWLQRAAQKSQALAQYRLGALFEKGLGVPLDARIAADWYAKAAELGNIKAMHNLAVAYANGTGRENNYTEAARWFRSAAERGLADSQFNLAVLHERGLGVQSSLADAYKWYAIAAAQGDAESSTRVEALLSQIPAAEKDAADKVADGFRATPADARANEAPALSEVLNGSEVRNQKSEIGK